MKIGNRLFPFPILNNSNALFSSYKDNCKFELEYRVVEQKNSVLLADTYCILECKLLNSLVSNGQAEILLYVECPETLFRKTYKIGLTPQDVELSYYDINGAVSLAAFVVAKENIEGITSLDFLNEYTGDDISFMIEKHDILAVDEGYVHTADFDSEETPKKDSIFVISKNLDPDEKSITYSGDGQKITIVLPLETFNIYKETGRIYKDIYLSLFGIPALVSCLYELKTQNPDFNDDVAESLKVKYKWFRIYCDTFERVLGRSFSNDDFSRLNEDVQKIFDFVITKSVGEINDFTFKEVPRNDD